MSLYLGLMSGTSLDGIDVAAVAFGGEGERPSAADLRAFRSVPYEPAFRARLRAACREGRAPDLCALGFELGERFAEAALGALREAGIPARAVTAIGSHGQTVWHEPAGREARPGGGGRGAGARPSGGGDHRSGDSPPSAAGRWRGGSTLQIGEAAVVAERTGIPVVADFRVRDVAAGGEGAPLTPYFDRLVLGGGDGRAVVNLGGMGNLTALPAAGSGADPVAFDTGPGVALVDAAAERLSGGERRYDEDGRTAATGAVSEAALAAWTSDPFFRAPPPRSTGRERFGDARLEAWLERHPELGDAAVLSTLTELTARTVADAFRWVAFPVEEVLLCGGGARNRELRRRLEERLAPRRVRPLEAVGWDGDAREAAAFALLARQHVLGIPVELGWATGAAGPRLLGKRTPA